jgi:hypothetical protein
MSSNHGLLDCCTAILVYRRSLDFMLDQLTRGRRFRILTIVYDCTRESLALMADTSLSGVP